MHVPGPQVFTHNLHDIVQLLHAFAASELFVLFTSCIRCSLTWAESAGEPLILYCSSSFKKSFSLLVSRKQSARFFVFHVKGINVKDD